MYTRLLETDSLCHHHHHPHLLALRPFISTPTKEEVQLGPRPYAWNLHIVCNTAIHLQMPQTWKPLNNEDEDEQRKALAELRDMFYTSIGPHGHFKMFVASADGAPPRCTSTSNRILSSLKGNSLLHLKTIY